MTDVYSQIGQWLTPISSDKPKVPKSVQHVTHGLPLAGFLQLEPTEKEFLLSGSGGVKDIVGLIEYFYGRLKPEMDEEKKVLYISTTGRNRTSPNCKTPLDVLIGMLKDEEIKQILDKIGDKRPQLVVLGSKSSDTQNPSPYIGKISKIEKLDPTMMRTIGLNTEGERGYLSSEEKPKWPYLDPKRGDVRVLVEYRSGLLVKAINDAISEKSPISRKGSTSGKGAISKKGAISEKGAISKKGPISEKGSGLIEKFREILVKLDEVEGDVAIFERWFNQET